MTVRCEPDLGGRTGFAHSGEAVIGMAGHQADGELDEAEEKSADEP